MLEMITQQYPEAWNTFLRDIQTLGVRKKIFISYAWFSAPADEEKNRILKHWLTTVATDLTTAGFTVVLDLGDASCPFGPETKPAINAMIAESDAALVIATPSYFASAKTPETQAAFELDMLLKKATASKHAFQLLPICWEDAEHGAELPMPLNAYLARNFQDSRQYAEQMMTLSPPYGLLPALLGGALRQTSYKDFVRRYQLGTLSYLPPENPCFTGRESSFSRLTDNFQSDGKAAATEPTQTICGIGGIGKSELALAYANKNRKNYVFCYWIASGTEAQLILNLSMLGARLGASLREGGPSENAITSALYGQLSTIESWLLIFDGVENEESIRSFLPPRQKARQHVLITSRAQNGPNRLCLDPLTPEEGLQYLSHRLSARGDLSQKQELITELNGLPFALTQAAACLKKSRMGIPCYLKFLHDARQQLSQSRKQDEDENSTYSTEAAATLLISLDRLKLENPNSLVLLMALAYLASDDIPLALCKQIMSSNELTDETLTTLKFVFKIDQSAQTNKITIHGSLDEALTALRRYLLIGDGAEAKTIKIDRFVQVMIQKALNEGYFGQDQSTQQPYEAMSILNTIRNSMERYYYHGEPGIKKDAMGSLLLHLNALIDHCQTELTKKAALIKQEKSKKLVFEESLAALNKSCLLEISADLQGALGNAAKQINILEKILPLKIHLSAKTLYTNYVAPVVRALESLGAAYGASKQWHHQVKALQQVLYIIQKNTDAWEGIKTAKTLDNLSVAYRELGELEQSKQLLEESLQIKRAYYRDKPNNMEIALTLEYLAEVHKLLESQEQRKDLLLEASKIKQICFGLHHPEVISTLIELANAYFTLASKQDGRFDFDILQQNQQWLTTVTQIQINYYGPDHPEVVCALLRSANTCCILDEQEQRKSFLEQALHILENTDASSEEDICPVLRDLIMVCQELKNFHGAVFWINKFLKVKDFSDEQDLLITMLLRLTHALENLTLIKDAHTTCQKAYELSFQYHGEKHRKTLSLEQRLERLANRIAVLQGNYPKAAPAERAEEQTGPAALGLS